MIEPPSRAGEELLRLLPPIRRARGYRLYDERGKRYLDLYQTGGRALLGHRPAGALLELKNLISRGLLSDLPATAERRLIKALRSLLPDHPVVRIFANEERLLAALRGPVEHALNLAPEEGRRVPASSGGPSTERRPDLSIADPALGERAAPLERWRPLLPAPESPRAAVSVLLPVVPFPASFAPAVACIGGMADEDLPSSDLVAPALLAALARSVYDVLRAVGRRSETDWTAFDAPWWLRRGPYLIAKCEKGEYSELFRRLLERGILINPHYPGPSICPADYTEGELAPLRRLADEWRGRSR